MEQQQRQLPEWMRREIWREPSPRRKAGVLTTQLAGIRQVRYTLEQVEAIERALVEHARKMQVKRE